MPRKIKPRKFRGIVGRLHLFDLGVYAYDVAEGVQLCVEAFEAWRPMTRRPAPITVTPERYVELLDEWFADVDHNNAIAVQRALKFCGVNLTDEEE